MASPAEEASTRLTTAAICGGSTGWFAGVGKLIQDPDKQVVVCDTGGYKPNPKWLLNSPTIQVMVRGEPHQYSAAYAKSKEVSDNLLGCDPFVTAGSNRWDGVNGIGDITYVGSDDSHRPIFSINFRITYEPTTSMSSARESL